MSISRRSIFGSPLMGRGQVPFNADQLPELFGINYASNVRELGPGVAETDVMTVSLDPKIAPVWSVILIARQTPLVSPVSAPFQVPLALGRLYVSGGGGGGNFDLAVPFDCNPITVLTVPASTVRITVDTTPFRIPGVAVQGAGIYSAYAVPEGLSRGMPATLTCYSPVVPAGGTSLFAVGAGINTLPNAYDAVCVQPIVNGVEVFNFGPYRVLQGISLVAQSAWDFPSASTDEGPVWIPSIGVGNSTVIVENTSLLPSRYACIYRLHF